MITSILVYGFMMFGTYYIGVQYRDNMTWKPILAILSIFVFFSAVRYDVGVDCLSYIQGYNYVLKHFDANRKDSEIGFVILMKILVFFKSPPPIFLGTVALMQMGFIFLALRKEKYLYAYLVFFLVASGYYFSWMNGMRQILAICIIVYAISVNNLRKKVLFCLFAASFHTSALLMLPIVFICHFYDKIWIERIDVKIALIAIAQVLPKAMGLGFILSKVDGIMAFIGYNRYADAASIIRQNEQSLELGPRYYVLVLLGVIITLFSNKIANHFKDSLFAPIYNLYFLGLILTPLFRSSLHLMRFLMYFNELTFLAAAYAFCYFQQKRPDAVYNWLFGGLASMYLLVCLYTANGNSHLFYQFCFGK